MESAKVFVYGTLRRHERYHGLLANERLVQQQAWTEGCLFDTGYGYPALVMDSEKRVYGEVYTVSAKTLQELDELEGYYGEGQENLYHRFLRKVNTDQGPVEAYIYYYANADELEKEIPFGDWKVYRQANQSYYLYFAYGSCMDHERFKQAGVEAYFQDLVGRGVLRGYTMGYFLPRPDGGRADLMEIGGVTEGKVYRIPRAAIDYLFQREGVHAGIYRPAIIDVEIDGTMVPDVLTFLVIDKEQETAPPEHYALEILRGAKETVSEAYFHHLLSHLRLNFGISIDI